MASQLVKDLEKIILPRGWYLYRRSNHLIYRHPKGGQVVVNSSRVGGHARTFQNLLAQFKRAELGICPREN